MALLSCLRRNRLRVCCGNPLDVPYVESFDYYWNYAISKSLILGPVKSRKTGSYTVLLEEGMPALKGSDPLDGYLLITADKTQSTSLTFPLVDIQNLTSPVCIVNFLREPENRDVKVEFQTEGPNGIRLLKLFNLKELPNVGWNVFSVDLSSLKTSGENVKLAFTFNDSKTALYLDRVYIGEQNKADLAIADLRVNPAVEKGSPVKISATVLNYAGVPSGSYTAELYRSRISGTPPLQAFDNISYIPAGQGIAKLKGYNVYYNGKLLNSAPLTECKYKNDGPAGTYLVTALYDNGESMLFPVKVTLGINDLDDDATATSVNTGIGSIIIEATPGSMANIYSISGNKIADVPVGTGSATVSVQPGCYLVRVGRTTAKVMVR